MKTVLKIFVIIIGWGFAICLNKLFIYNEPAAFWLIGFATMWLASLIE